MILKVCVVLICSMGYSLFCPKYNMIISKSKTLLELERCFHDFIIQLFVELHHFRVEYFGKNNMKNYHLRQYFGALNHAFTLSQI